jgi:hypothetical protein
LGMNNTGQGSIKGHHLFISKKGDDLQFKVQ